MNDNKKVPFGRNLIPGKWYRITQIDPHDPDPSMNVGAIVRCAAEQPGCIDPENHEGDGMGTQWFADFGPIEHGDGFSYRTLVNGVELVELAVTQSLSAEELAELVSLRNKSRAALDAYDENRCADTAQAHDNANLIYLSELANDAPALLAMASRLVELESALGHLERIDGRNIWEPEEIFRQAKRWGWPGPAPQAKGG